MEWLRYPRRLTPRGSQSHYDDPTPRHLVTELETDEWPTSWEIDTYIFFFPSIRIVVLGGDRSGSTRIMIAYSLRAEPGVRDRDRRKRVLLREEIYLPSKDTFQVVQFESERMNGTDLDLF